MPDPALAPLTAEEIALLRRTVPHLDQFWRVHRPLNDAELSIIYAILPRLLAAAEEAVWFRIVLDTIANMYGKCYCGCVDCQNCIARIAIDLATKEPHA